MPLEVIQFHFVAWPDHGVPDNHALMLNFVRRVRKLHPYSNPCPLLVHCSAGVGRTGTFIVLDTMLERMEGEGTLNIYDYVKQLREQRVLMVQTLVRVSKYRIAGNFRGRKLRGSVGREHFVEKIFAKC